MPLIDNVKDAPFKKIEKKYPTIATEMSYNDYILIVSEIPGRQLSRDFSPEDKLRLKGQSGYLLIIDSGSSEEYFHWMPTKEFQERYKV